jgi:hypothetical protein
MVVATVAHVACGALVLVTTVILTIQIGRHAEAEALGSPAPVRAVRT